jgi:hypothetical protein
VDEPASAQEPPAGLGRVLGAIRSGPTRGPSRPSTLSRETTRPARRLESYMKRELNENLAGNEVYYTNSLILLTSSQSHYQKVYIETLFRWCLKPFAQGPHAVRGPRVEEPPVLPSGLI